MALAVGFGTWISIRLVAVMTLAEFMMAAFIPILLIQGGLPFAGKRFNQLIWISILYFVGIIVVDLVNGTAFYLSIRGLARPIFIVMITVFFGYLAYYSPRSLFYFWAGSVIGAVKNFLGGPGGESLASNVFVYKIQPLLTSLAMVAVYLVYRRSRLGASAVFFLYGCASMVRGGRSFSLVCFGAAGSIFLIWFFKSKGHRQVRLTTGRIIGILLVGLIGIFSSFYIYSFVVKQGWMGQQQLGKYHNQTSTIYGETPWGLLLAGRLDVLALSKAIIDRPVFGHGTWPDIGNYVIEASRDLGQEIPRDLLEKMMMEDGGRGSGHSIFLGGWMQHGLFGAIYWIFVAYVIYKMYLYYFRQDSPVSALFMYPFFFSLWALAFSPWGTLERMVFGMFLGFYLVCDQMPRAHASGGGRRFARR